MYFCNILLLFFICVQLCLSDAVQEPYSVADVEYKKRQEIAEKYINSLSEGKEAWIDPFHMLNTEQTLSELSPDTNTNPHPQKRPELGTDEQPVFSDFRGEIISKNTHSTDEFASEKTDEPLGIFAKERHQVCVLDSIYISRWLKKLVLKIEKESELEPHAFTIPLDADVLNYLKELSLSDKSFDISQLDEFICQMISKSVVERKAPFEWSLYYMYIWDYLHLFGIVFILTVSAFICYKCFLSQPMFTSLCLLVFISIFWHWMHLYQQKTALKQAELSSMKVPDECRRNEFGLFENAMHYLKSFISNTDQCEKYYEALIVDPFWEVSLTVATSEAVTALLFQPLSFASRSINSAVKNLFNELPLLGTLFIIVFLLLLLVMMCNYKIKLPFFFGAIEPCTPVRGSHVQDIKGGHMLKQNLSSSLSNTENKCLKKKSSYLLIEQESSPSSGLFQREQKSNKSLMLMSDQECSQFIQNIPKQPVSIVKDSNAESDATSESDYEVLTDNEYPYQYSAAILNEHSGCLDCENSLKTSQDSVMGRSEIISSLENKEQESAVKAIETDHSSIFPHNVMNSEGIVKPNAMSGSPKLKNSLTN